MSARAGRLPDSYFERVYASETDPWGFASKAYERRKYDITLATLPRATYANAFEPGCAIGVLSARLAARCEKLTSTELVPRIAKLARERVAAFPHARVLEGALPECWPGGPYDLVVLSEVLYYLTREGLAEVLAKLDASLTKDAHVVAVHYRGETDYPLSGDEVHALLAHHARRDYVQIASHEEREFRLDLYQRASTPKATR